MKTIRSKKECDVEVRIIRELSNNKYYNQIKAKQKPLKETLYRFFSLMRARGYMKDIQDIEANLTRILDIEFELGEIEGMALEKITAEESRYEYIRLDEQRLERNPE